MTSAVHSRPILLVEEDEEIRRSLVALLQHEGYDVVAAGDGTEGLRLLEGERKPCVAVVDIATPSTAGAEFVQRVKTRRELADVVVIYASAFVGDRSVAADHVLPKPIPVDDLLAAVRSYCEVKPTSGADAQERVRTLVRQNVGLAELHRWRADAAAMVVHDLRSPLAVIETNLDYVLSTEGGPADMKEALEDVRDAARRIGRLTANLLDVARLEANVFVPNRVKTSVENFVTQIVRRRQAMARALGVNIAATIHWGGPVAIDVDQIQRVLDNILDNAFRYTPPGGRIEVAALRSGARLTLAIGNTGPAIPEAVRQAVFDRFVRDGNAHSSNAGLGLYFCRLAVEGHGGKISIISSVEFPTKFLIELPLEN